VNAAVSGNRKDLVTVVSIIHWTSVPGYSFPGYNIVYFGGYVTRSWGNLLPPL